MSEFNARIFFLIFFIAGCVLSQDEKLTLAISDFENNTNIYRHEMLGKTIPEMLKTELAQLGNITVLERSKINAVLSEQALGQIGIVDPQAAQKVGKLLGAEFVLTGHGERQAGANVKKYFGAGAIKGSDSIVVNIQGVVPIPR